MKIGLVRHFKVKHSFPQKTFLTKAEVIKWFDEYEVAEVDIKEVDLGGINWSQCYASPSPRVMHTASRIYRGEVKQVNELKELDILHLLPDGVKLPFMVWGLLIFIKSLSSNKETIAFRSKIAAFLDKLLLDNDTDILIISHWFVMNTLQKELRKRGLNGKSFRSAGNGRIYVFEK